MQGAPAYLAAMLAATPAMAQDMAVIEACASAPFGSQGCDADVLAENLGLLGINDVRVFKSAGMETFAMLTAMRHASTALYFKAEGEGCVAEEERTTAIEIWSLWVQLPGDAPDFVKQRFGIYDAIMDKIIDMDLGC